MSGKVREFDHDWRVATPCITISFHLAYNLHTQCYFNTRQLWSCGRERCWLLAIYLTSPSVVQSIKVADIRICVVRIEWRKAWSCLIQSATIAGLSTRPSFSFSTRKICLLTKFARPRSPSASQSTEVQLTACWSVTLNEYNSVFSSFGLAEGQICPFP